MSIENQQTNIIHFVLSLGQYNLSFPPLLVFFTNSFLIANKHSQQQK